MPIMYQKDLFSTWILVNDVLKSIHICFGILVNELHALLRTPLSNKKKSKKHNSHIKLESNSCPIIKDLFMSNNLLIYDFLSFDFFVLLIYFLGHFREVQIFHSVNLILEYVVFFLLEEVNKPK